VPFSNLGQGWRVTGERSKLDLMCPDTASLIVHPFITKAAECSV
jgi:hypothetical protein